MTLPQDPAVFNNLTFLQNLENILEKKPIDAASQTANIQASAAYNYLTNYTYPSGKSIAGFLNTFVQNGNPLASWENFQKQWKLYTGDTSTVTLPSGQVISGLENAFVTTYRAQLNMSTGQGPPSGDWSLIASFGVTEVQIVQQFEQAFSHLLSEYTYTNGNVAIPSQASTPQLTLLSEWFTFMTTTAYITQGANSGSPPGVNIASFEEVFLAFGFPASQFATQLKAFYDTLVKQNTTSTSPNDILGYFIPSQVFNQWFDRIRDDYILASTLTTVPSSQTDGLDVINKVLFLLISMINTLQKISASQAARLTFYTNWQNAYTKMLTDVPVIVKGSGSPIGSTSDDDKASRQDAATISQTAQQNIQARRDAVQNEAKQMQTTVNQSQDAANQQADIVTSILQELSTILSQIFR